MAVSLATTRRRLAGTLLGFVLGLLAVPASSQAGCGWIHERPVFGLGSQTRAEPLADPTGPTDRPSEPGPCPGGICSGGNPLPLLPPVSAPKWVEQWPCLLSGLVWLLHSSPLDDLAGPPAYAAPNPSVPQRPPRTSPLSHV